MSDVEEFSENNDVFIRKSDHLEDNNLEKYLNDHGVERLQGYYDALVDINHEIEKAIYEAIGKKTVLPHRPRIALENTEILHNHKIDLKIRMSDLLEKINPSKTIQPGLNRPE